MKLRRQDIQWVRGSHGSAGEVLSRDSAQCRRGMGCVPAKRLCLGTFNRIVSYTYLTKNHFYTGIDLVSIGMGALASG